MNRQTKFRGKTTTTGQWVYGSLVTHPTGKQFIVRYATTGSPEWHEVDSDTVGEYTGHHDANNKLIFEGDIVEAVFEPLRVTENPQIILGVVEWCSERAEFIVNCNNIADFDLEALNNRSGYKYADGRFCIDFAKKGKVIGNIHDNKDLMGKWHQKQ